MHNIPQVVCGVIPPHILTRVAGQTVDGSENARATLEHMRELATGRAQTLIDSNSAPALETAPSQDRQRVYDAGHRHELPGRLVMSDEQQDSSDVEVQEAWKGSRATYDFFERVFGRRSIDGKGMRLDATVHYGTRFENAMWNGRQMVYGNGDGRIFHRFTASVDVIGHELTHGVTQYAAALGYSGQTGALNEHISDAFGIMVKQYTLDQSVHESDWLIGAELFGPAVRGSAVRSLAFPGAAYDDPILGIDPQPSHMRDYVHTTDDNGGVHINSGILNHAFHLAARAVGGKSWEVLGQIWYVALTDRLKPEADFADFTRATVDIAGELFGNGGAVQRIVADAWADVGLPVSIPLVPCPGAERLVR
ncbi:MAG TPA: M4 family metallopeptidase [Thermoanaerobaculia bacterium]|jgi:Zn-dependent metalloprotease|nr:M4 family metallopeptidase [Thermoanaerobaculia bacterium]